MYDILAELYFLDGTKLDISYAIRRFHIRHSIKLVYPVYELDISTDVLKYITPEISHVELTVNFSGYDDLVRESYKFSLLPIDYIRDIDDVEKHQAVTEKSYRTLQFIDKELFTQFNTLIKSNIYKQTKLIDIIKQHCKLPLDFSNDINDTVYDEIYIPTMTFYSLIRFLQYHYSFYPGTEIISFKYDIHNKKKIRIQKWKEIPDVTIRKVRYDMSKDLEDEISRDDLVITAAPITFEKTDPVQWRYVEIIAHPKDTLYSQLNMNISDFIKQYSAVHGVYDLEKEGVTLDNQILRVNTHNNLQSVTSIIGDEFRHLVSGKVLLENSKIKIFAGDIVRIEFAHPDLILHEGNYIVDYVDYTFIWDLATYRMVSNIFIERSNLVNR